jgi:hypothetical protein
MNMHQKIDFLVHMLPTYTKKADFSDMNVVSCSKNRRFVILRERAVWN